MTPTLSTSTGVLWARFRFSVVGTLLSSPPPRGRSRSPSAPWPPGPGLTPPPDATSSSRPSPSSGGTTWRGARHDDPVAVFRRAVRKDCGKVSLAPDLAQQLSLQYHHSPHWSYQLHYDNLAALVQAEPALGPLHSYATVRRVHEGARLGAQAQAPPERTPRRGTRRDRGARPGRSAATRPSTSDRSGISTFTTDRSRCSRPPASGSARSPWASSMTTRGSAATSSGTSPRPPRIWCTGSRRRSRNAVYPARS